jgi:beta-lactamase class A
LIAYAACDLATGRVRGSLEHDQFPAASTLKLFIASAFWRSEIDPDELAEAIPPAGSAGIAEYLSPRARLTLGDLALLMLAVSDNAATNVLIERLGFDAVNGEIDRLGLERTALRRPMMTAGPENVTTPADLAAGLAKIAQEEPRILHALALAADSFLPFLLPEGVAVYPKSGELDTVRHEVALIEDGRRRIVTAVCSTAPPARPDELAETAFRLWAGRY